MSNISTCSPLPSLRINPLHSSHFPFLPPLTFQFRFYSSKDSHLPKAYLHLESPQVFVKTPKDPPSQGGSDWF